MNARTPPVVIVSGLGRCGSSLLMQMLSASGLRCAGGFPAYEPEEVNHKTVDPAWLAQWQAVKILNPHLTPLPDDLRGVCIWLDRDTKQQAASQIKMLTQVGGVSLSRVDRRGWHKSLVRDRPTALDTLRRFPRCHLRFEALIETPHVSAKFLAEWLSVHDVVVDAEEMAAAVLKRRTRCLPDMRVELVLCRFGADAVYALNARYPDPEFAL